MPVTEMTRDIRIHPSCLSHKLKDHIFTEISNQLLNNCTIEHGHILKILELKKIIDNKIENSISAIVVTVVFLVEVYKPVSEAIENAKVMAIYKDGILANINEVQKVLIPATTYSNSYSLENNKLKSLQGSNYISQGDTIKIKIKALRYSDHSFSCIGEIA